MDPDYPLHSWAPIVASLIPSVAPRTPQAFAMKWLEIESGGNPCAVGDPGQLGPDGNPAEIGIGQLYNPDDFVAFGARAGDFRAYCPAAAQLAAAYRQAQQDYADAVKAGDTAAQTAARARMAAAARQMQTKTRPLTQAELAAQAKVTLLDKIEQGITHADALVHEYGLAWSVPDYWKLVKAPHALPAILGNGLPAVVKKLGRAPHSWAEFRQVLGMEGNSQWVRALNACEACGNAVAPAVV
jgi:hypothetical protein